MGTHYEDLLSQATGVETLEDILSTMHTRIQVILIILVKSSLLFLNIKFLMPKYVNIPKIINFFKTSF